MDFRWSRPTISRFPVVGVRLTLPFFFYLYYWRRLPLERKQAFTLVVVGIRRVPEILATGLFIPLL